MKLTKKEAIERSIELWEWLAKTGKQKEDWPKRNEYWDEDEGRFCSLCDYTNQEKLTCSACPIGPCYETSYSDWEDATTIKDRKKYASLFLEQLKELING